VRGPRGTKLSNRAGYLDRRDRGIARQSNGGFGDALGL
jgi:hypothetical protein